MWCKCIFHRAKTGNISTHRSSFQDSKDVLVQESENEKVIEMKGVIVVGIFKGLRNSLNRYLDICVNIKKKACQIS
jgi:uncharacterized Rossmann fold enzyme